MSGRPKAARWPDQPSETAADTPHATTGATASTGPATDARPLRRPAGAGLLAGLSWPRLTWYQEVLAIIAGDVVYEVIRASAPQKAVKAFHNAAMLTALEPSPVQTAEAWLRDVTSASSLLTHLFGWYYAGLHLSVTVGVLVWLWARRPEQYARARTALFALTFGGLLIFWIFPVAPPRLVTPEAINALGTPAIAALDGSGGIDGAVLALVNPYAAFPSLHVGWAAWCAWAVWAHLRGRPRWLAWAYPAGTTLVVVATSNHYVIDVVAALLLLLLAVVGGRPAPDAAARRGRPARWTQSAP